MHDLPVVFFPSFIYNISKNNVNIHTQLLLKNMHDIPVVFFPSTGYAKPGKINLLIQAFRYSQGHGSIPVVQPKVDGAHTKRQMNKMSLDKTS